jgi:hypothetical protein
LAAFLLLAAYVKQNYIEIITGWPAPYPSLAVTIIVFVQLAYLWIVNEQSVLNRPIDKLRKRDLVLPIALGSAYGSYALSILFNLPTFSVVALVAMISLYIVWFIFDLIEFGSEASNRGKINKIVWMSIDVVCVGILGWIVFEDITSWMGSNSVQETTTRLWSTYMKDGVIVLCVSVFIIAGFIQRVWRDESYYQATYTNYLNHVPRLKIAVGTDSRQLLGILQEKFAEKSIRVLDFGCANGIRGKELLEFLGIRSETILKYIGLESNGFWRNPFGDSIGKLMPGVAEFCHSSEFDRSGWSVGEQFDIIIMSHVFYHSEKRKRRDRVSRLLAKDGVVIVRGSGPNSIFSMASRFRAQNISVPSYDAFWISRFLLPWVESSRLKCLVGESDKPVSVTLPGQYDIEDPVSSRCLSEFIRLLYGEAAEAYIDNFIWDTKSGGEKEVPVDDVLFVLHKAR